MGCGTRRNLRSKFRPADRNRFRRGCACHQQRCTRLLQRSLSRWPFRRRPDRPGSRSADPTSVPLADSANSSAPRVACSAAHSWCSRRHPPVLSKHALRRARHARRMRTHCRRGCRGQSRRRADFRYQAANRCQPEPLRLCAAVASSVWLGASGAKPTSVSSASESAKRPATVRRRAVASDGRPHPSGCVQRLGVQRLGVESSPRINGFCIWREITVNARRRILGDFSVRFCAAVDRRFLGVAAIGVLFVGVVLDTGIFSAVRPAGIMSDTGIIPDACVGHRVRIRGVVDTRVHVGRHRRGLRRLEATCCTESAQCSKKRHHHAHGGERRSRFLTHGLLWRLDAVKLVVRFGKKCSRKERGKTSGQGFPSIAIYDFGLLQARYWHFLLYLNDI